MPRIVGARMVHNLLDIALLDNFAGAHYDDAVTQQSDDIQVVGDEQIADAEGGA